MFQPFNASTPCSPRSHANDLRPVRFDQGADHLALVTKSTLSEIGTLTVQSLESNEFVKVSDPVEAEDLKRCPSSDYFEDFAGLGLGPVRLRNFA